MKKLLLLAFLPSLAFSQEKTWHVANISPMQGIVTVKLDENDIYWVSTFEPKTNPNAYWLFGMKADCKNNKSGVFSSIKYDFNENVLNSFDNDITMKTNPTESVGDTLLKYKCGKISAEKAFQIRLEFNSFSDVVKFYTDIKP